MQRLVEGCGVTLRKRGNDLVGACPFHDDSSPSLVVTPGKNLWHCLGACWRGGGPIDWVMTAQGVSFRHAVELLRESSPSLGVIATTAGTRWADQSGPVAKSSRAKLPSLVEVDAADQELLNTVVGYYAETLASHDEARGFLARRKIGHPEAVRRFRLGFADRTLGYWIPGNQTADGKRIPSRLQALGVLRSTGHEHFRGSLVIPVVDEAGDVGEVYGRKIRDDLRDRGAIASVFARSAPRCLQPRCVRGDRRADRVRVADRRSDVVVRSQAAGRTTPSLSAALA